MSDVAKAVYCARELLSYAGDDESYNRGIIQMLQAMYDVSEKEAKDMINYKIIPLRLQSRLARFRAWLIKSS
jgi:hypothetical protein